MVAFAGVARTRRRDSVAAHQPTRPWTVGFQNGRRVEKCAVRGFRIVRESRSLVGPRSDRNDATNLGAPGRYFEIALCVDRARFLFCRKLVRVGVGGRSRLYA